MHRVNSFEVKEDRLDVFYGDILKLDEEKREL